MLGPWVIGNFPDGYLSEGDVFAGIQGSGGFNNEILVVWDFNFTQPKIAMQVELQDEILLLLQVDGQVILNFSGFPPATLPAWQFLVGGN